MLIAAALAMTVSISDVATLKKRGFEVLEQIRREYYLPDSKLYCEDIDKAGKKSGPCFNWSTGVLLTALTAAAKLDPKYKPWLREYADASRIYWNDKGPVPGYDVLPCPKPVDRYYDDNAWMVLALVETYEVLGDKKYLDWAEETLRYVYSGWDEKLGGGIYWRESDKASKNTCSNAPSAAAYLAVAKYRRPSRYILMAEKILDWTAENLLDPSDHLFWDNKNLEGKIDKTKWTYNTGLYIRARAMYASHIRSYKPREEQQIYNSSLDHWFDKATGAAKDGGRFVHLWFEGLHAFKPKDAAAKAKMLKALDYVYANCRNAEGRYANGWNHPIDPKQAKFELIDQASVARAFLFAAGR